MAKPLDPNDLVTLEKLTIANMWEVAAIREVLEQKGLLTKPEILDAIRELRKKNPTAKTPLQFEEPPEPTPSPKVIDGNAVIEQILELIAHAGFSPKQAREVLDRTREAIDWGEREAKKTAFH